MPQIIKTPQTKIITKNGEVELSITVEPIVLEITLNINSDGIINVSSASTVKAQSIQEEKKQEEKKQEEKKPESTNWAIPSFGTQKIKFGKKG